MSVCFSVYLLSFVITFILMYNCHSVGYDDKGSSGFDQWNSLLVKVTCKGLGTPTSMRILNITVRDNIEKGCYDDRDLEKIKTDDFLLELYCRHQPKAKVEEVASLIHESLKWRMEYQINDLSDDSFDDKMWEQRAIFFHNTDKDGHKVLITQVKMHRKGDSHYLLTVKKFFAWHIEKAFQENPGEPLMLLFDMDGAGLANLDMDFIRFCINCFKSNYPCILGLMLVYEMPWIFNGELLCLTSMCLTSMWFCQIFLLF
uniref:CRAL-TRIO domain-containing protein n=1 Tax=Octopus bimaculoides TaxID=37653 RepID=A0A0L8HZZ2_OCTBM